MAMPSTSVAFNVIAGESRHVAVVGHLDGYVSPLPGDVEVDALDALLELVRRDLAEEERRHAAIVDDDPGRADADGVDSREVRGGLADGVVNAVEMVLRVRVRLGLPHGLRGEDLFAVDDG